MDHFVKISSSKALAFVGVDNVMNIPPPSNTLEGKMDVAKDVIAVDGNDYWPDIMVTGERFGASYKGKGIIYIPDSSDDNPAVEQGKRKCLVTAGSSTDEAMSSGGVNVQDDSILNKLCSFKRFDIVDDYSDHFFAKNSAGKQHPKNWAKKIQDEWRILEKDLPDEIFVRVYESRMDLLRAVIVGAQGTPYHHGLFFFDVLFPSQYPNQPPQVHYHSGGLSLNPNLYECGQVCLSLLGTWDGDDSENWVPGLSTMLQVLVSIQALILNAEPYFNEPGYESIIGTVSGQKQSDLYNEDTWINSLKTMLYTIRRPPKHFEDFIFGHFYKHSHDILLACKAYMDGAR